VLHEDFRRLRVWLAGAVSLDLEGTRLGRAGITPWWAELFLRGPVSTAGRQSRVDTAVYCPPPVDNLEQKRDTAFVRTAADG